MTSLGSLSSDDGGAGDDATAGGGDGAGAAQDPAAAAPTSADESTTATTTARQEEGKEEEKDDEASEVGNLVVNDEWEGLTMELSEVIRTAIMEDLKANAREFLGKDNYELGDLRLVRCASVPSDGTENSDRLRFVMWAARSGGEHGYNVFAPPFFLL
jgi:hypothetical protein